MIYMPTFGGDPLTAEALAGAEADTARAAVDDWWVRQMVTGRVLPGPRLAGPYAATIVRFRGTRSLVEDRPFTDEAELVSGFGMIEAADLGDALSMVRSWPARGYIEIRPLADPRMRAS